MPSTDLVSKIVALAEACGTNDKVINQRITELVYSVTVAIDDMARAVERQTNLEAWAVTEGFDPSVNYGESESQ